MLIYWFLKMDNKPGQKLTARVHSVYFFMFKGVVVFKMLCNTGDISCIPRSSQGFDSSLRACHRKQCMAGFRVDHGGYIRWLNSRIVL